MAHDRPLRSVCRDLVKYFWRQLSIEFSSEVRRFSLQPVCVENFCMNVCSLRRLQMHATPFPCGEYGERSVAVLMTRTRRAIMAIVRVSDTVDYLRRCAHRRATIPIYPGVHTGLSAALDQGHLPPANLARRTLRGYHADEY